MCRIRKLGNDESRFSSTVLSSRCSSSSLDEFSETCKCLCFLGEAELSCTANLSLRSKFQDILSDDEDIESEDEGLLLITNKVTRTKVPFKPPSRLHFSTSPPEVANTHTAEEYDRHSSVTRAQLIEARIQCEMEKQIATMEPVEVDLVMGSGVSPPTSLGIRIFGVNIVRGAPNIFTIYVRRVLLDSVAGCDGRIFANDLIVEVNGVSLVGVSQELASKTLSNLGRTVHIVLARIPKPAKETLEDKQEEKEDASKVTNTNAVVSENSGYRGE